MSTTANDVATHKLGPLGAEPEMSEMSQMVQQTVHRYAQEVMRPAGIKLDRMTPEEVIAPGSPYWEAREKFIGLGDRPAAQLVIRRERAAERIAE